MSMYQNVFLSAERIRSYLDKDYTIIITEKVAQGGSSFEKIEVVDYEIKKHFEVFLVELTDSKYYSIVDGSIILFKNIKNHEDAVKILNLLRIGNPNPKDKKKGLIKK